MRNENVVLITGCSTGIGRALAEVLIDKGYIVIASARDIESIRDLRASLHLSLDVTDEESIKTAVRQIIAKFNRIDILVNNAGYAIRGALEELSGESIKALFDVNVFGITNMIRYVIPEMRKARSGKIINIGSISGKFSQPINGVYCASKFAVEALSDALRLELYSYNIQSTVIEPGPVQTNFRQTASAKACVGVNNPNSAYAFLYSAFIGLRENQKETDPKIVAYAISRLITTKHLKARYRVAVPYSSQCIAYYFNDSLKEYLLRKRLKIQLNN